ncbi:DUF4865 family protein [Erwinia sp. CGal63]|uniref:DUF4865 family protein n=1 Tax=Erwinia sp. CGal63 TaxID=2919889 RepID=UPI003008EF0B
MLAMQYKFTLPASYDMAIIKRRIEQAGPKLDNFCGLLFKTFLYSCTEDGSPENRYAPFYLWQDAESMHHFLQSAGFAALTAEFGWPKIHCWTVFHAPDANAISQAAYAVIREGKVCPFDDLNTVATQDMLCAWDISRWQRITANFFKEWPVTNPHETIYRIGYVAHGGI